MAVCFVLPRTLLLTLQGPAQGPHLQEAIPDILGVVGFSSLAQPCSYWTAQAPLPTWNLLPMATVAQLASSHCSPMSSGRPGSWAFCSPHSPNLTGISGLLC